MLIDWPTKEQDLKAAEQIIKRYLEDHDALGVFEVVLDKNDQPADIKLSGWVAELAWFYWQLYGIEQGDFVLQMVVSRCITNGYTVH